MWVIYTDRDPVAHEDTFRCDTMSAGIKLSLSALRAATFANAGIFRRSYRKSSSKNENFVIIYSLFGLYSSVEHKRRNSEVQSIHAITMNREWGFQASKGPQKHHKYKSSIWPNNAIFQVFSVVHNRPSYLLIISTSSEQLTQELLWPYWGELFL